MMPPVSNRVGLGYPDGNQVAYAYSPNNWLAQVTTPQQKVTTYERDKVGNITHIANHNATMTDTTYDKVYRVTSLTNQLTAGAKTHKYPSTSFQGFLLYKRLFLLALFLKNI